jgi:hypothetical protein
LAVLNQLAAGKPKFLDELSDLWPGAVSLDVNEIHQNLPTVLETDDDANRPPAGGLWPGKGFRAGHEA